MSSILFPPHSRTLTLYTPIFLSQKAHIQPANIYMGTGQWKSILTCCCQRHHSRSPIHCYKDNYLCIKREYTGNSEHLPQTVTVEIQDFWLVFSLLPLFTTTDQFEDWEEQEVFQRQNSNGCKQAWLNSTIHWLNDWRLFGSPFIFLPNLIPAVCGAF